MLAPERRQLLEQISTGLDASALTWLSGYFAGLAAGRNPAAAGAHAGAAATGERSDATARATILYASQTGNGRRIAEKLARNLENSGIAVRAVSTADYPVRELAQERLLYLIASTHGDGDAPDDARAFNDFLFSRRAGRLERLAYSVLALGDSSYPQFCAVGRKFDAQLATLGARRLAPVTDCDVDYEATAAGWMQAAAESAQAELQPTPRLAVVTALRTPALTATREQPFEAEVLVAQRITGRGSDKVVTHLEIAAPSQRLAYEPGDAVGIWQRNPVETVERVLELVPTPTSHVASPW
jgi:sulfite reductase (NADPH) flavoprotein alpha-component